MPLVKDGRMVTRILRPDAEAYLASLPAVTPPQTQALNAEPPPGRESGGGGILSRNVFRHANDFTATERKIAMSDNTPSQGVILRTHIEVPCRRQEPETQAVRFGIGPAFPKPLEIKRLSPRWTKRERAIAAFILAGIEGAAMRQCTDSARAVVLPFPPRPRRIEVHISAIRGRQPIGRTRPLMIRKSDLARLVDVAERMERGRE
jgi:hypothetical protein